MVIQIEMKTGPHQKKMRSCLEKTQKMNSCLIATCVSSTPYLKTSWKLILNGNIKDKNDPVRGNPTAVFYLPQKRSPNLSLNQLKQIKPDWSVRFAIIKLGITLIWRDIWENNMSRFLVSITSWLMSKLFDYWTNVLYHAYMGQCHQGVHLEAKYVLQMKYCILRSLPGSFTKFQHL